MIPDTCELPDAPPEKGGWPWRRVNDDPLPAEDVPTQRPWPTISVITPSFNQGRFLEETIRSVALQGYPATEHIIIDGGSKDESVEVIQRYERWVSFWVSEPDRGQSDAINKGFARAKGDILCWLNSDDLLEPGALRRAARKLRDGRNGAFALGDAIMITEDGAPFGALRPFRPSFSTLVNHPRLHAVKGLMFMPAQPAVFWRREVYDTLAGLDENLVYAMDLDYWLRALEAGFRFQLIRQPLARYRFHSTSLSGQGWRDFRDEWKAVVHRMRRQTPVARRLRADLMWWTGLLPASLITLPWRGLAYLRHGRHGRLWT